mgnify:CR=1 FL=1
MSLNKLTDLTIKKQWMNLNCKSIICEDITITGSGGGVGTLFLSSANSPYVDLDLNGVSTIYCGDGIVVIESVLGRVDGAIVNVYVDSLSQCTFTEGTVASNDRLRCNQGVDCVVKYGTNTIGYAKMIASNDLSVAGTGWNVFAIQMQP